MRSLTSSISELPRSVGNSSVLGISPLKNVTIIRLKRPKGSDSPLLEEVDCVESMFMSPFHDPVSFSANASVGSRHDPTCSWNFIGTEPCIPKLTCPKFNLAPPTSSGVCEKEYLEVSDGYKGQKRFCGKEGPMNLGAALDLRDLYVKFKSDKVGDFNCSVVCSSRGESAPLPLLFQEKINPKCLCGEKFKNNRIVGGEEAKVNEFPWMVALVEAKTRQPFCGGSIINDRIILTAGHCFKGKFLDVRNIEVLINAHTLDVTPNLFAVSPRPLPKTYDEEMLKRIDASNKTLRFRPEEIFVHPLYVPETNDFDVGGMLLSEPIKFEGQIANPICLPELGSYLRTFAKQKATIAGWGLPAFEAAGTPEKLQKVDVNVFPPKKCKVFYAHRVNRRMMCAGFENGKLDSCSGDSGGPLVVEDRPKSWYQIGTVSWGDGCAREGNPGVYFRTTETSQWLHHHSNVNNAVWCAVPD